MAQAASALSKQDQQIDAVNAVFLTLSPVIGIAGTALYAWHYGIHWIDVGLLAAMYWLTGLSITGGYHRFYAHRTYECSKPLQLLYLFFGAAAAQNSVLNWASDHRYHHRYVDTDEDPYNILKGAFYAHIGWIFYKDTRPNEERFRNVPDLLKDPLVMFQHRYYLPLFLLFGLGLPAAIGALEGRALGGLLWGGILRTVIVHHMTWFINSLAHLWGSRPYSLQDTARDNWWLGPLTFGEGYHNFHHRFQADYRNGLRWYQFDATKWWINLMHWTGFVTKLRRVPDNEILKARLQVELLAVERRLAAAAVTERMWARLRPRMQAGRERLEQAMLRYQQARAEYRRQKDAWSAEVRLQWRERLAQSKAEFQAASARWQSMLRAMQRIPQPSAQGLFTLAALVDILKKPLF